MRKPRFRIAWLMAATAVVAVDTAAIRWFLESTEVGGEMLLLGALPMANVLVVGLLVGRWRPASRPYVLGFEAFGFAAVAGYVVLATYSEPPGPLYSYLDIGLCLGDDLCCLDDSALGGSRALNDLGFDLRVNSLDLLDGLGELAVAFDGIRADAVLFGERNCRRTIWCILHLLIPPGDAGPDRPGGQA